MLSKIVALSPFYEIVSEAEEKITGEFIFFSLGNRSRRKLKIKQIALLI